MFSVSEDRTTQTNFTQYNSSSVQQALKYYYIALLKMNGSINFREIFAKTDRALVRGIDNGTQVCAELIDEGKTTFQVN